MSESDSELAQLSPNNGANRYVNDAAAQQTTKTNISKRFQKGLLCVMIIMAMPLVYLAKRESPFNFKQDTDTSNLCVWNVTNSSSYINGVYSWEGTSESGYPIYSSSISPSCNISGDEIYLFNSVQSKWTISSLRDDTSSSGLKGICPSQTFTDITQCNGLWQIPPNTLQKDVTMSRSNECPSVSCIALQLTYDADANTSCVGVFQNKISDNLYRKGTLDLYLFFSPTLFRWGCGDQKDNVDINECFALDSLEGYAVEQSWHNADQLISDGDSVSMSWSNDLQATIHCINTAAPTQDPTPAPTQDSHGARLELNSVYLFLLACYVLV